ncbi:MAG: S-layer homology domain-containing protein [Clostridia bacterium]|nr:S-layer homology domain-containing protein [Clostridia bacterium]
MKRILTFAALVCTLLAVLAVSVSSACDHNWVLDLTKCTSPTCTAEGSNAYYCSRCSQTKSETVDALGHDYVTVSGKEATCTADSTVTEKCSVCGDERKDDTKALGHTYEETKRTEATCSKEGSVTYKCSVCKETKTESLATVDHDYTKFISSSATCTTKGQSTYQCSMCSAVTLVNVAKLGHDLKTTGGPTCTESGKYTYTCTRCDYTKTSTTQKALGHDVPEDLDDWKVVTKATCEQEGKLRAKCERCKKYVYEEVEKLDHDYGDTLYITKIPTSSSTGKYVKICENCGTEVSKTIAKGTTNLGDYTIAPVKASVASGDVERGTKVEFSCDLENVKIYYALGGKSPLSSSYRKTYNGAIEITKSTVIKVYAVYSGSADVDIAPSDVASYTYLVDNDSPLVYLEEEAYLGGYMPLAKDKKFRPDDKATRYEVIEAMDYLFGSWADDAEVYFTDVDKAHKDVVAKFVGAELLNGYEDLTFRGENNIKRSELCKVLALALGLDVDYKSGATFSDVEITHWAYPYISALTEAGYLAGDPDGTFRPEDNITRAELAVVLNRIANVELTEGVEIADMDGEHWAYNYVCSAVKKSEE